MPIGDRIRKHRKRRIREGDEYTIDEDVELEQVKRIPEPPVDVQGEPWNWTKPGDRPKGWREDGHYDSGDRSGPGPFDGRWEE